jgi:2,3-dimethylmalate lyase
LARKLYKRKDFGDMTTKILRSLLSNKNILVAPGCYDAFTASLIEKTGFKAAYISGAGIIN